MKTIQNEKGPTTWKKKQAIKGFKRMEEPK